jgi:hypothetical protein
MSGKPLLAVHSCRRGDCRVAARPGESWALQVEQQFPAGLGALAHPVDEADELLLALRRGPDDHQQALGIVLQANLPPIGLLRDAVLPLIPVGDNILDEGRGSRP